VVQNGEFSAGVKVTNVNDNGEQSVTAIADKLGVEFALIHRKRDGKAQNAPERMEILVGDVRDKVIKVKITPD
jgi:ribose-phosphate pyrophosphokinase